jgi:hypothetical protein
VPGARVDEDVAGEVDVDRPARDQRDEPQVLGDRDEAQR